MSPVLKAGAQSRRVTLVAPVAMPVLVFRFRPPALSVNTADPVEMPEIQSMRE